MNHLQPQFNQSNSRSVITKAKDSKSRTKIFWILLPVLMLLCFDAYTQNLLISGITTPAAANGTYVKQSGTMYTFSFWVHTSGNYMVYKHQYDGGDHHYYWNIDDDYDDARVFFYYEADGDVSPAGSSYTPSDGTSTGGVVVSEVAVDAEIDIRGNGVSIADGDGTPRFEDHTKFGSANISGGTLTRSFVIYNTGAVNLTLDGSSPYVSISGTNAGDFSVTTTPTTPISAGGSTTFVITFNPSAIGGRTATVSIANSDSDEDPYNFTIHGSGFTPKNIIVSGVSNPAAANGTYVHQGTDDRFEYWKHSSQNYYLHNEINSGTLYWHLDVDIDGSDDDHIFSKSSDEASPIGLTGWAANAPATGTLAVEAATPESDINLLGNSVTIFDEHSSPSFDDHTFFGSLNIASGSRTRTFTIQNLGSATLTLSGASPYVTISGSGAAAFSITTPPASSVAGYGNTTFIVTFDPSVEGTNSAVLNIASNDADEANYNFSVEGWGGAAYELLVSNISSPAAANGVYTYQGILNELEYWKHESEEYYIYNGFFGGDRYWHIDNDTNTDTYIRYSANHDEDPSPTNVTSWNGGTATIIYNGSEIDVKGNSVSIADGDTSPSLSDHTDFGNADVNGGTVIRTFTIENTGGAALSLTDSSPYVAISGTHAGDFSVTTIPSNSIASSGSSIFRITFNPSASGTRIASLSIANDDDDENPYNFNIQGTGFAVPTATTNAATSVVQQSATLNGTINANTLSTTVTFEYGLTDSYGTSITADESPVTGTSNTSVSKNISSLTPSTTYHFRVKGVNSIGTTNGSDQTFTTLDCINPTAAGTIGNAQEGCLGFDPTAITSLTLPSGHSGTLEYKWQQSTTSSTAGFSDIASSNSATFDPSNLSDTTWFKRLVLVDCHPDWSGALESNVIEMAVFPAFAAGTISSDQSICFNTTPANLIGVAPTGGDTPYTYQWISSTDGMSYSDVSGATSLNYQAGALSDTTYYRLEQTSASGCGIDTTSSVKITVYPLFVVGSISSNQNICYNTAPAKLIGVAPTGGTGPYTYQWQSSTDNATFSNISGETNLDYQPGVLTDTMYYQLIQSSASGCGVLTTNKITINVYEPFAVGSISASQSVCYNSVADELIGVTPTGGGGAYAYQWQNSTDGSTFSDISGANSINFQPPALTDTTYYRQLQGSDWGCGIDSTNIVTIIDDFMAPTIQASSIVFSDTGAVQLEIDWTNGNGSKRVVFIKEGTTGTAVPVNYDTYTANTHFKKGSQIGGSGWYCVANGTADSVIVNGLMPNTTYRVMVCEYNKDSGCEKYLTTESTGNASNQLTKNIMINEVDADTPGTDDQEFIELYDGGTGNTSLDGLIIVFYNGAFDYSYDIGGHTNAISLDGFSTDSDGYFLIAGDGFSGAASIRFTDNTLQNGADAIAMYADSSSNFPSTTPVTTTYLVDALIYDTDDADDAGLLVLLNASQPQVNEAGGGDKDNHSNQRITNGSGDARNTSTYTQQFPTPGEMNGNPKMQVLGNSQIIDDEDSSPSTIDHTDFENAEIFLGSVTRTFTIRNVGEKPLVLSSNSVKVVIGGADAADFNVNIQPTTSIAIDSATTTFSIVFDPTTAGVKDATISIYNNDRETDSTYTFAIKGTGITLPEIVISGNTIEIADGDTIPSLVDSTDFGVVLVTGGIVTKTFAITNPGSGTLTLGGTPTVEVGGIHAADFTISALPTVSLAAAGGTSTFNVQFDPSAIGLRKANISIDNNDSDEDPYNFNIQGIGSAVPIVSTDAATTVVQKSATMNGTVNPNSDSTVVIFEYGLTTGYGAIIAADQSPITGNTNTSVSKSISGLTPSTTYHYRVVGENSSGTTEGSNVTFTTLDCIMPTSAGSIGNAQWSCANFDPETITSLSLPSGNTGTLEYKWQKSIINGTDGFTDIPASNSSTYDPPLITETTWFKRLVRVDCESDWSGALESNVIEEFIYPEFTVGSISSSQSICFNATPAKLFGIAPTGGSPGYSYQWQSSSDGITFIDVLGATELNYQAPALSSTTYYRLAQISGSGCGTLTTNIIKIHVYDEFKVGSISENQTLYYQALPEKFIGIDPTGGAEPYIYQWQSSTDGYNFTDIIYQGNQLDYQAGRLSKTTYFRLLQSSASSCGNEFTNTIIVIVFPEFSVGSIESDQQIVYGSVPEKLTATTPRGGCQPYAYQWQSSSDSINFINLTGAIALDYQPPALTETTYYQLIQSSAFDYADKATNLVTITVYPEFVVGSITSDQIVCYNSAPELLLGNAPTGGNEPYSYQWQQSSDGILFVDIIGATALNYQPAELISQTYFRQVQTSSSSCGSFTTNVVTMTIQVQPLVDISVEEATICANASYQLTATAQNYESLTWISLGDGIFNDVNILNPIYTPGENDMAHGSVTLAINVTAALPCEIVASDQMILSFYDSPEVDAGIDLTVYENTQVQLNASVQGSGNYSYSWTPAEIVSDPTILNPVTSPITQTTTFTLQVTDNETGCIVEDQITIKVETGVFYQIRGRVQTIGLKSSLPATNIFFTKIEQSTTTNDLGEYTMMVPAGYCGWAIPTRPGYIFEPDSIGYINVGEDIIAEEIGGTFYLIAMASPDSIIAGQRVQLSVELVNQSNSIIACSWQDETGEFCNEINANVEPTQTTLYTVFVSDEYESTYDTVRVYVSTTTGINDLQEHEGLILLYPNPTNNIINLEISGDIDARLVSIVNPNGTLVRQIKLSKSFNDHKVQLNLEHLIDGSYHIIITNHEGQIVASKKVVKI